MVVTTCGRGEDSGEANDHGERTLTWWRVIVKTCDDCSEV